MSIKQIMQNNLPYIIVLLVVFVIVTVGGALMIDGIFHAADDNGIYTQKVIVIDKYYGQSNYEDYYLVKVNDNVTYSILTGNDNLDKRIFDSIDVGKRYEFTLHNPRPSDKNQHIHILQVHNDTMPAH